LFLLSFVALEGVCKAGNQMAQSGEYRVEAEFGVSGYLAHGAASGEYRVEAEFGVSGYLVHGAQIDSSTITDPGLPKSSPKSGPQKRHPNRGKTNETGAFMRIAREMHGPRNPENHRPKTLINRGLKNPKHGKRAS
jgi:hypothetical protein